MRADVTMLNSMRVCSRFWSSCSQFKAVEMAERNYGNAHRFVESAHLSYTETELLLEGRETSRAMLDSANENLLSFSSDRPASG